jgi:hypothetical protein
MGPFFKHFGSKFRLSHHLPYNDELPIIEVFGGSAGYACRYGINKQVFIAECNGTILKIWNWLKICDYKEILAIPSETIVRKYWYSKEESYTGKARTSSVRLGLLAGKNIDDLDLNDNQKLLLKLWMFSKSSIKTVEKLNIIPKHGGYFTDNIKNRIANDIKNNVLKDWNFVNSWEKLPNIRANWIIDPPYQNQNQLNKCYGEYPSIDYKKLGEWVKSLHGNVIAHELNGADWLDFKPFKTQKIPTITGFNKVKLSNEVVYLHQD